VALEDTAYGKRVFGKHGGRKKASMSSKRSQKCKNKWQKSKSIYFFLTFFGVGGAGWRCRSFLFFKYSFRLFFCVFYFVKFWTFFFDNLTKSTLLAGGNSKSYRIFEI
jgi:hypothetical protein